MTVENVVSTIISIFPPILLIAFLSVAGIVFIIGFSKHGINFIKYGFKQTALDENLKSELADLRSSIDNLRTEVKGEIDNLRTEVKGEISGLRTEFRTELDMIKVNHFGHLKNYLGVLNAVLLEKGIIDVVRKAEMDNELRGM